MENTIYVTTETDTLDHFFCVKSHAFMYKTFTFKYDTLPESNTNSFEFSACNVMQLTSPKVPPS